MISYIYDFLSILFDKLKEKDKIKSVILFGSTARGNAHKDSDIDIFVNVSEENQDEIETLVQEAQNEFELRAERRWHLKGIKNALAIIVGSLESLQWKEIKNECAAYGIVLYGKYNPIVEGEKSNKVLIEYDLSRVPQKNKMDALRKLYGYTLKKGKKIYTQSGISKEVSIEKITQGIIADIKEYRRVVDILKKNKVSMKIRHIRTE